MDRAGILVVPFFLPHFPSLSLIFFFFVFLFLPSRTESKKKQQTLTTFFPESSASSLKRLRVRGSSIRRKWERPEKGKISLILSAGPFVVLFFFLFLLLSCFCFQQPQSCTHTTQLKITSFFFSLSFVPRTQKENLYRC